MGFNPNAWRPKSSTPESNSESDEVLNLERTAEALAARAPVFEEAISTPASTLDRDFDSTWDYDEPGLRRLLEKFDLKGLD